MVAIEGAVRVWLVEQGASVTATTTTCTVEGAVATGDDLARAAGSEVAVSAIGVSSALPGLTSNSVFS